MNVSNEMQRVHLVLGGARSGKSRYAEALVEALPGPWVYIATAQAFDTEMQARIAEHRLRRHGQWVTLDAPLDLAQALVEAAERPVLVDCLTLWVTNLLIGDCDIETATAGLLGALRARRGPTVLVANETGLGIVPDNALARRFRDAAGLLNQRVAARAAQVDFVVAGIPMRVKG